MNFGAIFFKTTALSSTPIGSNQTKASKETSLLMYKAFKAIKDHKKNRAKKRICNGLKKHIQTYK